MPQTPSKPDLRLVSAEAEIYDLMRAPQTTAERVKRAAVGLKGHCRGGVILMEQGPHVVLRFVKGLLAGERFLAI